MPRSKKQIPAYKQDRAVKDPNRARGSIILCRWMCLALLGLGGLLCYVRAQAQTEIIRNRTSALEQKCDVLTKTRDNMKVKQEAQTTGRKIRMLVRRMNLGLERARTGQVRRISVAEYRPEGDQDNVKRFVTVAER